MRTYQATQAPVAEQSNNSFCPSSPMPLVHSLDKSYESDQIRSKVSKVRYMYLSSDRSWWKRPSRHCRWRDAGPGSSVIRAPTVQGRLDPRWCSLALKPLILSQSSKESRFRMGMIVNRPPAIHLTGSTIQLLARGRDSFWKVRLLCRYWRCPLARSPFPAGRWKVACSHDNNRREGAFAHRQDMFFILSPTAD